MCPAAFLIPREVVARALYPTNHTTAAAAQLYNFRLLFIFLLNVGLTTPGDRIRLVHTACDDRITYVFVCLSRFFLSRRRRSRGAKYDLKFKSETYSETAYTRIYVCV